MAPQTTRSLIKDFRASFRKKKVVDPKPKEPAYKEADEEELAKLAELRESVGSELSSHYTQAMLLGFLRARSLNVKETETLLKLDENLKKFLRIDQFKTPRDFKAFKMSGAIGFDKEGCLVRVINIGGVDVKGLMSMISTIQVFQILLKMVENDTARQEEENKKTGKKNTQFVYILNLENLTMNQVTYKPAFDCAMQALKLLQDHYHDALKSLIFVNAPSFFSSVFKLFKPVIQESLHQKIKIYDQNTGREELIKEIDADILPQYLGGNRVDSKGDPKCSEIIPVGSTVPESCYADNFLDVNDPEVITATVPAGSTLNFRYPIHEVGTLVRWHVQGKDNDIGMGLYSAPFPSGSESPKAQSKKKKEDDMSKYEQLAPIIRSQCHICPEEGSAVIWFTGNVIIHFDNTYSWMNSKEVLFKVTTIPPSKAGKNGIDPTEEMSKELGKMAVKN